MRATSWTLLIPAMAALACERTPREDFASRPSTPVATASAPAALNALAPAPSLAGRCVLPTPPEPPSPVPAGPAPGCPADPERPAPAAVTARIAFPDAPGVTVKAEVVRSQHDMARGLMYRRSLPEDGGMLFDLRVRTDHKFWMHNTCIPLDLLYVDDDGLIVGIVENAPTLDDESRGVDCPSVYVLEVNAGWTRRHGVKAGQRLSVAAERGPE
jgi:uncharacterized membrane protein (UPF0127 family)